ncbi:MAG: hypothetical protein ACK5N4_12035 [Parabacteroides gordonii]|uniref:hypothetical protein n=1 Tax=Parabacteroides gordonii TaxID=574930 RepID=UPI003A8C7931
MLYRYGIWQRKDSDESGCPQGVSPVKITSGSPVSKLRVATSPFISNWYWSSSVYNGNSDRRCKLNFNNGNFNNNNTNNNNYVRCVRDLFGICGYECPEDKRDK